MTIKNALNFIKLGLGDENLRHRLLKANGREGCNAELAKENLVFSQAEFEEAYSLTLFNCQRPEDAESLMEFRMWWTILVRSYDKPLEYNS
ncbi:MAG: hypothetical protein HUN04_23380 [Desulfobacter sp.]|nr:MAG: hypothetical protein HUN04_23380 [Desulfobacter sp.]